MAFPSGFTDINKVVVSVADNAEIKKSDAIQCAEQVREAVSNWSSFAEEAGLSKEKTKTIREQIKHV